MSRPWLTNFTAWLLGCAIAVLLAPAFRTSLSPWRAIGEDKILMFSSDSCMTSRRAIEFVRADPRLKDLILPVPASGPQGVDPIVCTAALEVLGKEHPWVRWLPQDVACRWLSDDAFAVIPEGGVPTPSWYFAGGLVGRAGSAEEAALFSEHGWRIEWTPTGLRLSRLDEPAPQTKEPVRAIRRIEELGMSSYRDDRW